MMSTAWCNGLVAYRILIPLDKERVTRGRYESKQYVKCFRLSFCTKIKDNVDVRLSLVPK